jgi:hypothetical protein
MTRARPYDGDFDSLPKAIRRAAEADRSYYDRANCKANPEVQSVAWTLERGKTVVVGGQKIPADDLIELACIQCSMCDVQWDCATAAIVGEEPVGTWGDKIENIHFLRKRDDRFEVLEAARSEGIPVRVAISHLRPDI